MEIKDAIEYIEEECEDCPESDAGHCLSNSHCLEVKQMAIDALCKKDVTDTYEAQLKAVFDSVWETYGGLPKYGKYGVWVPTKEELPEEYGEYLVTWTGKLNNRAYTFLESAEYEPDMKYWYVDHIKERGYTDIEVIAWMPLPEKYKAESEEV